MKNGSAGETAAAFLLGAVMAGQPRAGRYCSRVFAGDRQLCGRENRVGQCDKPECPEWSGHFISGTSEAVHMGANSKAAIG